MNNMRNQHEPAKNARKTENEMLAEFTTVLDGIVSLMRIQMSEHDRRFLKKLAFGYLRCSLGGCVGRREVAQ